MPPSGAIDIVCNLYDYLVSYNSCCGGLYGVLQLWLLGDGLRVHWL